MDATHQPIGRRACAQEDPTISRAREEQDRAPRPLETIRSESCSPPGARAHRAPATSPPPPRVELLRFALAEGATLLRPTRRESVHRRTRVGPVAEAARSSPRDPRRRRETHERATPEHGTARSRTEQASKEQWFA